jgi:uncharacterized protein (UPF0333 family)
MSCYCQERVVSTKLPSISKNSFDSHSSPLNGKIAFVVRVPNGSRVGTNNNASKE